MSAAGGGSIVHRMREIVFDTETTGLDPQRGDRLVEIGCIELVNRIPTGAVYHGYFNPERDMPAEAEAVHG
ncbi:exonuclease domain-containing protein, partial [Enterococcus faecalis]|uniref:exonuclease domain-containing protein n=1 Tax=Enterococcus faecalis TaxID=1351 RepID=UPI00403F3196